MSYFLLKAISKMILLSLLSITMISLTFAQKDEFRDSLNMKGFHQHQTQWCWAAVTQAVKYYKDNQTLVKQCRLASHFIAKTSDLSYCCGDNDVYEGQNYYQSESYINNDCNQPYYLRSSLRSTGNFAGIFYRSLEYNEVVEQMDLQRPLGVGINWDSGGGHAILIYGATKWAGNNYYSVWNPLRGRGASFMTEQAVKRFGNMGRWTRSFKTKGSSE